MSTRTKFTNTATGGGRHSLRGIRFINAPACSLLDSLSEPPKKSNRNKMIIDRPQMV